MNEDGYTEINDSKINLSTNTNSKLLLEKVRRLEAQVDRIEQKADFIIKVLTGV